MEAPPQIESALAYAELGWQVFPVYELDEDGRCACPDPGGPKCTPGKHPRTKHGLHDATDLEDTVRAWWEQWPRANIGIAMGSATGAWALDVDVRINVETGELLVDGEAELAAMCGEQRLPETLTAATGGGGRHLLFAWDDDVPVGCPKTGRPGIDVKGEGGYILVAPSGHVSGKRYAWLTEPWSPADIAPAPAWLVRALLNGPEEEHHVTAATPPSAPSTPVEGDGLPPDDELRDALAVIPANCDYDTWLAVGMALHDETKGAGFEVFHAWSARAAGLATPGGNPAYRGRDDCLAKWRSFKVSRGNVRGRRTIFGIAIERHSYRSRVERTEAVVASTAEPEWPWSRLFPPDFPIDTAFPPALSWLRAFFERLAWTYQVPVDLPVLLGAPIAMAALAGKLEVKVPGERWTEPAVLWTICAMTSGGGKSPVHRDLIRPVRAWEKKLDNSRAIAEQVTRVMVAEADVKRAMGKLNKRAAQIDANQKREAQAELVEANERLAFAKAQSVQTEEIIASEATTERLVELLQRSFGRVLVSDAEGDIFDVAMGRYSNQTPNLGPWLKGYDGDTIKQERVGGDRVVHRPLINVGVATQPEALQFLTDKVAQGRGFVARFCAAVVLPQRDRQFMPGREMSDGEFAQWNARITELLDVARPVEPDQVTLSAAAAEAFSAWGQSLFSRMDDIELEEGEDPRDAWHRKYPGKVLRVALLLHGLQADGLVRPEIDLPTMQAAIAWGRYLSEHNDALAVDLRADPRLRIVERALAWLERHAAGGGQFTRRELLRGLQGPRSLVSRAEDLSGPLGILVETGWIAGVGAPLRTTGPTTSWSVYRAHPELASHLARHRAAERARSADRRSVGEDGRPRRW